MKKEQINVRDPFVIFDGGKYYMFGTRAKNFGVRTGGFDVYVSDDLENWSEPHECFDSAKYGLNGGANWAPEVHKYGGKYYMLATFVQNNGLRGTYSLISDNISGPFVPHSKGALTPDGMECLDGTLYVSRDGSPYLVFCHEHTEITDGAICYVPLSDTLDKSIGEPVVIFSASSCSLASPVKYAGEEGHYVTDGPFLYRSRSDELFMIWSTFVKGNYAELVIKFKDGELGTEFEHAEPLILNDGGHGMLFSDGKSLYFTYHTPNKTDFERPEFRRVIDNGGSIEIMNPSFDKK